MHRRELLPGARKPGHCAARGPQSAPYTPALGAEHITARPPLVNAAKCKGTAHAASVPVHRRCLPQLHPRSAKPEPNGGVPRGLRRKKRKLLQGVAHPCCGTAASRGSGAAPRRWPRRRSPSSTSTPPARGRAGAGCQLQARQVCVCVRHVCAANTGTKACAPHPQPPDPPHPPRGPINPPHSLIAACSARSRAPQCPSRDHGAPALGGGLAWFWFCFTRT